MKNYRVYSMIHYPVAAILVLAAVFAACETPAEVDLGQFDDPTEYFKHVMQKEEFFRSEEEILEDPPQEGLAKLVGADGVPVTPFAVRRRIISIDRSFSFEFRNDNLAIGTMVRTIEGTMWVRGFMPFIPVADTIFSKPFTETATRKALFQKVDNTGTAENDWKMIAVSLFEGGTGTPGFDIQNLKICFRGDCVHEYTDPLTSFLNVGRDGVTVPAVTLAQFRANGFSVEVTLESSHAEPEIVYLRHGGGISRPGVNARGYMRRLKMEPDRSSERDSPEEIRTRTYHFDWTPVVAHPAVGVGEEYGQGRFSAIVEVISHSTLNDTESPVQTQYWGVPFVIE